VKSRSEIFFDVGGRRTCGDTCDHEKSASEPLFLTEYPIKVNLKSETPTDDGVKTVPTSSTTAIGSKQRFSFLLEEMGCRVDCTVVQQADNVPVSELLRSAKRFELKWWTVR
jgi:hypothetical protein